MRSSAILSADIRVATNVPTVKRKWICFIPKHRNKPSSVQLISKAHLIFRDRLTLHSTINIAIGHSTVASIVRIRNFQEFFNSRKGHGLNNNRIVSVERRNMKENIWKEKEESKKKKKRYNEMKSYDTVACGQKEVKWDAMRRRVRIYIRN